MIVEYVDLYGRDGVLFILTCVHTLQSVFYSDCNLSVPHIKLGNFNLGDTDVILDGEINNSGPLPYLVRQPVALIRVLLT